MAGVPKFDMVVNKVDLDAEKNDGGDSIADGIAKKKRRNSDSSSPSSNLNHSLNGKRANDTDFEKKTFTGQYGGMLLALMASLPLAMASLLDRPTGYLTFWKNPGILLPSILLLMYYEFGPGKKSRKTKSVFDTVWPLNQWDSCKTILLLASHGTLSLLAAIFRYWALKYLYIGDATFIAQCSPILVVVIFAPLLLGERLGFAPILTAILELAGFVFTIKPPFLTVIDSFDEQTLIGIAFASGSLICSALMTIITRKIRRVNFALILMVFGLMGMLQTFLLQFLIGTRGVEFPRDTTESLLLAAGAALFFLGQLFIILSLKMEEAGTVCLVSPGGVVFGFPIQFIFIGFAPDLFSGIGGSIVFFGAAVTAFRKYLSTLPKENWTRKIFFLLLH